MALHHFLLIYDLAQGKLVDWHDLGQDGEAAAQKYSECEAKYQSEENLEIVLVGADSLDTIRKTHSHYFDGAENIFEDLTDVSPAEEVVS